MDISVYVDYRKFICIDEDTSIIIEMLYDVVDNSFSHWFGTEKIIDTEIRDIIVYDSEGYILDEEFIGDVKDCEGKIIKIKEGIIKKLIEDAIEAFNNYNGDLW